MPLSQADRRFLHAISHLKAFLMILAIAVLIFLLISPPNEIRMTTSIIGLVLCGVFWLTQRLLGFITVLDLELTRLTNTVMRTLPEGAKKGLSA